MSDDFPANLWPLVRIQRGVFTRGQALRAGLTPDLIRSRVRRGTWRVVYPGVYTTVNAELPRASRLWAALLYAGKGAVLSYETAAELHGLADRPADAIHVSIPTRRRVVPVPGVVLHRSARVFRAPSVHDGPPRTNVAETVLDLVSAAVTFDDVCGWITRAISRELTDEGLLSTAMADRKMLRWRAELSDLITAAVSGDHSVLEYRYTRDVERAHGFPESSRQMRFADRNGRRGRRDRCYTEYQVVVELDGRLAHPAENLSRDKARDNAAAETGYQTLRYGWQDIMRPCWTAVQVAKVLQRHGWEGQPLPCSIYCSIGSEFPG